MKGTILSMSLAFVFVWNGAASAKQQDDNDRNDGCVEVCHVPRGNPDNAHTICVGPSAVPAHVGRHGGDFLGPCEVSPCEDSCEAAYDECATTGGQDTCEQALAVCLATCACDEDCCGAAWELCLASEPADPLLCDHSRDACLRGASCLFCGDGIVDSAEECDDGPFNGTDESTCTDVCTVKSFGSIHVFGFLDEDGDGVQDDNEGAFPDDPGKTFELLDENGNVIMTSTTLDGMVWFEQLTPGTYTVRENPIPDGFAVTTLPNERTFTIISGEELVYEDGAAMLPADDQRFETNVGDELRWGNTELTMLGDFVFEDRNANGIQDSEDMGIPNVQVTLTGGGPDGVIGTPDDTTEMMFTDANGLYKFNNLNPGEVYNVTFTNPDPDGPDAYRFSPRQVGNDPAIDSDGPISDIWTLAPGEFNDTLDAGLFRNGP